MKEKIEEKIEEKTEKETSKFSFWRNFSFIFLVILFGLIMLFGLSDLFKDDFSETFTGIIMFTFPFAIILTFFIKWFKEHKSTGKWIVLNCGKIKWWQCLAVILLLMCSTFTVWRASSIIKEENEPSYQIKEWNPYGFYA